MTYSRSTSLWFETALTPAGWRSQVRVLIGEDGRIIAVTPNAEPLAGEERHGIAVPGLPNLHSHAFQRAMAGLTEARGAERDSFWTWRELMYRFVQRLDPEALAAVAALAFIEMLEHGFTRTGEFHYVHHQPSGAPYDDFGAMAGALAAAASTSGIALTLLPVFYATAGFGDKPPSDLQRRFVTDLDSFEQLVVVSVRACADLPDPVIGVAPHSLRAVPLALLEPLTLLRPGAPIHIHIAEQSDEVEECLAWSERRPVDLLYDTLPVDGRWCLVHATHADSAEIQRIARSEAVIGLCPITEANLGDGLFPARDFMELGGRWGIGSDSNVQIAAAAELRMLEYGQRLLHRERNVLAHGTASTGTALFTQALLGGAQALGQDGAGLVAGASADIVTFDTHHPSLAERSGDTLLDSWVFAAAPIDCVWRRGALVVTGGRHHRREQVVREYRRAMKRLMNGD